MARTKHSTDENSSAIAELKSVVNVAMPHWRGMWFPSTATLRIASFVGTGASAAWMTSSDRARDTGSAACERHARSSASGDEACALGKPRANENERTLGAHA